MSNVLVKFEGKEMGGVLRGNELIGYDLMNKEGMSR